MKNSNNLSNEQIEKVTGGIFENSSDAKSINFMIIEYFVNTSNTSELIALTGWLSEIENSSKVYSKDQFMKALENKFPDFATYMSNKANK